MFASTCLFTDSSFKCDYTPDPWSPIVDSSTSSSMSISSSATLEATTSMSVSTEVESVKSAYRGPISSVKMDTSDSGVQSTSSTRSTALTDSLELNQGKRTAKSRLIKPSNYVNCPAKTNPFSQPFDRPLVTYPELAKPAGVTQNPFVVKENPFENRNPFVVSKPNPFDVQPEKKLTLKPNPFDVQPEKKLTLKPNPFDVQPEKKLTLNSQKTSK